MKNCLILILLMLAVTSLPAQTLNSTEILNKSIQYHDPNDQWPTFNYQLFFDQELANGERSKEEVIINNQKSYFTVMRQKDGTNAGTLLDSCFNVGTKKIDCSRIKLFRNYYSYLWGLPMKLKDPGTPLEKEVRKGDFDGNECYILRVPYEKDTWYFYIDQQNYSLRGYEFFKDEEKGIGERIYLSEEFSLEGMKIPNGRKWYNTHDDKKYLATDVLVGFELLK